MRTLTETEAHLFEVLKQSKRLAKEMGPGINKTKTDKLDANLTEYCKLHSLNKVIFFVQFIEYSTSRRGSEDIAEYVIDKLKAFIIADFEKYGTPQQLTEDQVDKALFEIAYECGMDKLPILIAYQLLMENARPVVISTGLPTMLPN